MLKEYERINQKSIDFNSSPNISVYIGNSVIVLFEGAKKQKVQAWGLQRKNRRTMLSSKYAVCDSKESRSKEQNGS